MTYGPELNVGIPKIGGNFRANKKFMWLDGKTAVCFMEHLHASTKQIRRIKKI